MPVKQPYRTMWHHCSLHSWYFFTITVTSWWAAGWETKNFWNSPNWAVSDKAQNKIPLAQACFLLARPNFHSHWRALVSQPAQDGISNHRCPNCLLNHLFRCRLKKMSKLCITGLCDGNSPYKRPVTRKMFPFDDVIMMKFIPTGLNFSCSASHHGSTWSCEGAK